MSNETEVNTKRAPTEGLGEIDGERYYAIPDIDQMPPFLMSIVSDGDRWMFISSTGGLTAGRGDPSRALFRYETDDRLHDAAEHVGPATAIQISPGEGSEPWRPFHNSLRAPVQRSIFKSVVGDSVIFEEHRPDLHLTFRYRWKSCDRFGFVRTASLTNDGAGSLHVELIDGLVNLLPYGLDPALYAAKNNLTNAYKRSEVIDAKSQLAVFSLESGVVDRPEPAEVLRSTVAWSIGLEDAAITVDANALADFEAGRSDRCKTLLTGRPGAYLLRASFELSPNEEHTWDIVADVAQDQLAVVELRNWLTSGVNQSAAVAASLDESTRSLVGIVAPADALQQTGDRVATAHHFANVVYNTMRGGVPLTGYRIDGKDFSKFVNSRNRDVAARHQAWLDSLTELDRQNLFREIEKRSDHQLMRLGLEYLPFSFSRRHGDPSRPWNAFSIRVRDTAGEPIVFYEGNWRDLFQNWEALLLSFPEYLPGVISVFLNASTPDGFNPYRITRDGVDWEEPNPDDPWSNIGYWGDHQIVYLLRLIEASERFLPGHINQMLGERLFSYAAVPYRLAAYDDLVQDPKATIAFDEMAAARSAELVEAIGGDGRLLLSGDEPYLVTMIEKLVVPALAKLSNFVPGGGIWMNTQRPEWNDANNALVGYGLSMVTLYYLRRYLDRLRTLVQSAGFDAIEMSTEVASWMFVVSDTLGESPPQGVRTNDRARKRFLDALGRTFSDYRSRTYDTGFSGVTAVELDTIVQLCNHAIDHLDDTIHHGRRSDGLYHSYNLIHFGEDGSTASVEHLQEMLEGQVAVLESGVLSPEEKLEVIDALFASVMYRADQRSFTLYPARRPPSFLEKNVIPAEAIERNPLLAALLEAGDRTVIEVDGDGRFRFSSEFANRDHLDIALDRLADHDQWSALVSSYRADTQGTYESVFNHHAYTGRSGSMYGYEGIGSIYWHMVAKLLVAVQESVIEAPAAGAEPATLERLIDAYWRVRSGLGFNKTAREFGAIPTDPYSHTPSHAGAQQPGMTGLVKEELLTRPLEVGVRVEAGQIVFDPVLLRRAELLVHPESWRVLGFSLDPVWIELGEDSLGLTLCQVPLVVSVSDGEPGIDVVFTDGTTEHLTGSRVDSRTSAEIFARSGRVARIHAVLSGDVVSHG